MRGNLSSNVGSEAEMDDTSMVIPVEVRRVSFLDQVGVVLSTLCLVHCILTPFLLISLPLVGGLVRDATFHRVMLTLLVPIAGYSFVSGVRQHGHRAVLALGWVGIILIALGTLLPEPQSLSIPTILGSLCLVCAHVINRRLCRKVCAQAKKTHNCCYHES